MPARRPARTDDTMTGMEHKHPVPAGVTPTFYECPTCGSLLDGPTFADGRQAYPICEPRMASQAMQLLDQAYQLLVLVTNRFVADGRSRETA
jgi:hypothetical protein